MPTHQELLEKVSNYYTKKVLQFGTTPAGVDWNSYESQELRFEQLLKIIKNPTAHFSFLDYGCGYGSLYKYMQQRFKDFDYTGYDISEEMVKTASEMYRPADGLQWKSSLTDADKKDYVVASGILNVKQETPRELWEGFVIDTLHELDKHSKKGFAFNVLTKYSDNENLKDSLYYADPAYLFDFCKKNISKYVTLVHDYALPEFTILVTK
ncbi:MAG TPA: class I SAM-dependent methyltransferase [Bacteroidia bacterium]|jgi:SAM-dependent methyltransferase|nr:class I SAM-dependent methyltransferase [Bacteroidia bacterium]